MARAATTPAPGSTRPRRLVPALAAAAVAQQIAYPLVTGTARDVLTVTIVVSLAAVSVAHAAVSRGPRFAALLVACTLLPGLAVEMLGVHTGVPFGDYRYTGALGPRWLAVPVVIGLAWTMLAWPAVVAARTLVRGTAARVAVAAWTLAGTDLFLDPQLVHGGYWRWTHPTPALPGVHTVPLTNLAGWLVVALLLCALLVRLTPDAPAGRDLAPLALLVWLYVGWILALAVFGDLRAAAGWGALALAPVALPVARRLGVAARTRCGR